MAFSFGAPAAAAGGPTNGGNSSNTASTAPGTAPAGGFSFGGTPSATAAPAAPTAFGATTTPPAANTTAPAASSTGGFSFGANAPAAPATAAPASTSTFGFGGNAPSSTPAAAPSPSASSGFTFAHAPSSTTPAPATANSTVASANVPVVTVPEFVTVYPNMFILGKLDNLLPQASLDTNDGRLAAQELDHALNCGTSQDVTKVFGAHLAKPLPYEWKQPNAALRQELKTNPHVSLHGQTAALTLGMLEEVFKLSDELHISEVDALTLYAEASLRQTRLRLQDRLDCSFVDNALSGSIEPLVLGDDVFRASRELFFYEQSCAIKATMKLIQYRLELNTAILAATDQLLVANLVDNLIAYIKEWTRRTDVLEQELSNASRPAQNMFGLQTSPAENKEANFAKVHLKFGYDQRQTAAESLFYLTYHTQCTGDEVGFLIDLIKDLSNGSSETNGLKLLDPFHDVPNAYYDPPTIANNQFPFTQALPPLREKDSVTWQHELVDQVWKSGGKPQLLQSVSTLVLSVVCALNTRTELVDRNTHAINSFGTGNALFPPQDSDTQQLLPIHTRLNPMGTGGRDWKRIDIWGVLVASYALLLRSLPSVASSPRVGGSTPNSPRPTGPVDVKTTWRACMNVPTGTKAFSCIRQCLMPSFERHKEKLEAKCDTSEFFMSVSSDFIAHFLDVLCASGDVPISRSQWERDAERDLDLRREQQQQTNQFRAWTGTRSGSVDNEVIPTSVDLMVRPDCLDDVIALAIALCSVGPSYATFFWSKSHEEIGETRRKVLVPSRALRKLQHQLETDKSLLPIYVSFLAALALAPAVADGAESGASIVNRMLQSDGEASQVSWSTLMNAIRWYARELSPGSDTVTKSTSESNSSSPGLPGRASTAYYYGADDNGADGSTGYSSSQHASSSSSSTSSKTKEMGETNTNILLSHLGVIATVASQSAAARSVLVSTVLPVAGQEGDDPFLTVLFLLSIAPLTPLLRGAVFSTIASLLKVDGTNPDERKNIEEQAMKGWKLLDTCRVLPISLLDQYESLPQGIAQVTEGLSFPPSSISLVSKETKGAWLPPERLYGIVFEMEQIESRRGQYPSTEGFLQLLTSLFAAAGSPAELGQGVRSRPGCTPYVEYVANFVLSRALDTKKGGIPLPFRTTSDKYRLASRALEVIETVLVRYTVPPPASTSPVPLLVDEKKNQESATSHASHVFELPSLVAKIVIAPNERDAQDARLDYRDSSVVRVAVGTQQSVSLTNAPEKSTTDLQFPGGEPPVPRAKSPGFTVLAELLSSSVGPLLNALVKVLTDDRVARGIRSVCGLKEYKSRTSEALFGQTPPTVGSARAKSSDTSHISSQALLQPLLPQLEAVALNRDDAIFWRETSIILVLRILCAAAAREETFAKSVSAGRTLLKIIPVLRFHRRSLPASGIVVRNVQASRLADLLISFGRSAIHNKACIEPLPAVIQYVQCDASTIVHDGEIASPAVALIYYASHTLGTNESIRALLGSRGDGISRFAKVMGKRLSRSSQLASSRVDSDIASLILDSILSTFRGGCARETSISHIILGLPFMVSGGNWVPGTYENAFQYAASGWVTRDCFDAILERLSSLEFLTDSSSSYLATQCFEIMYRLTEVSGHHPASERRIKYAANMLRSNHFWTTNLMRFLADHTSGTESLLRLVSSVTPECRPKGIENCLQCIAWLLKSVSSELLALDYTHAGSTSGQRRQLLSLLFSSPYRLLMNVLVSMPISDDRIDYLGHEGMPSRETLEMSRVAMPGAPELVEGYTCIDKSKLARLCSSSSSLEEQMSWAGDWNAWASWDCASSHLSVGLLYLIESAMLSLHPRAVMGTGSSAGAFELHMPVDMLKEILSRIVGEGSLQMNGRLSPNVSYTLSRIVLLLSEQLASNKAASDMPSISTESNHVDICRLLIHAVISSAFVDQGRPLLFHEKLRTAIFGLALSIAMKCNTEANLDELDREFLQASISLGRLAASASSTGRFEASGEVDGARATRLAQVAFASILDLYRTEENLSIVPLLSAPADSGVGRTIIQSIVSLIANQDEHIYNVAEKVIICEEGPEILMEARLPQAIRQAANDYVAQEQKVKEDLRYSSVTLDIPPFLRGHMLLMKSLLLSPVLLSNRRKQLDVDTLDVLLTYTDVVHRMFNSFPQNAEVLYTCLQCLLLCCNESASLQQFVMDDRGATWNQDILQLTYALSQNPLPRRYLLSLPMKMNDLGRNITVAPGVSVSDSNRKDSSWWDVIELSSQTGNGTNVLLPGPPSGDSGWRSDPASLGGAGDDRWAASKYEMALMGAEVLESCLSYLESLSLVQPIRSLDVCALSRGLCRCSDVAKGAHFRLEALQRDVSEKKSESYDSSDAMEITYSDPVRRREEQLLEMHYIGKLKGLMQHCSEKLLLLISVHVRALRHAYENEYDKSRKASFSFTLKESCDSVSAALDYTKLDFTGMQFGTDEANKIGKLLRDFVR